MNLNEIMADYRKINRFDEAKRLVDKWSPSGLLEGLESDENKLLGMARLIENQAKELIDETTRTGTAASQEAWSNVALPLVRRVFAKIVAQDLLSVQPMALPSGLVFWLEFQYGTTKPTNTSIFAANTSVYGNTSGSSVDGRLYDWDYTYTKNYVSASNVTVSMTSASFADLLYSADYSSSFAATPSHWKKITLAWSGLTNPDKEAVSAIRIKSASTASGTVVAQFPEFSTKDATNAYLIMSGAEAFNGTSMSTVEYVAANTQDSRGDFESGQSGIGSIPEINLKLRSEAIVATTRKLRANWTPEIEQDLNAYHNIDAEAELTSVLSDYISMEIDMDLIEMLWENALTIDYWSAKVGNYLDSSTGALTTSPPVFYGTQMEWYQTLTQKINKVSNEIGKRTLRGGANWLIVGPKIATILETMRPGFASDDADIDSTEYQFGMQKIGTLNSRWKVYKNPYFREDAILLGFRGGSFLETGAVYAPYIPIITTPTLLNPVDFTPTKGVMTRSAKKITRKEFYAKIYIRDTNLI